MKLSDEKVIRIKEDLKGWIKDNLKRIGANKVVIGISGGKDSAVVAALLKDTIGPENVYGLLLPRGNQKDLDFGIEFVKLLGINYDIINIKDTCDEIEKNVENSLGSITKQTTLNIAPRVRMTILYAYSQSIPSSVVVNTSNLSEAWVGYSTIYGDATGAFSPLGALTSDEVIQLGYSLGLDSKYLEKPPADGLTGSTDEEVLGFSYEVLNKYIRTGEIEDLKVAEKIDKMNRNSRFKLQIFPIFNPQIEIALEDIAKIYGGENGFRTY